MLHFFSIYIFNFFSYIKPFSNEKALNKERKMKESERKNSKIGFRLFSDKHALMNLLMKIQTKLLEVDHFC